MLALEGMKRSLTREDGTDGKDADGEFWIKAGIFLGNVFIDENSGLYVAAEAKVVHEMVLRTLYKGLESSSSSSSSVDTALVAEAADVTKSIIDTLLLRASNPTRDMKKRKKRAYLKYLKDSSGPTPDIIHTAVQICLKQQQQQSEDDDGGEEETDMKKGLGLGLSQAKDMLEMYADRPYLGSAMEETWSLVTAAEEALAAAGNANADEDEDESDTEEEEEGGHGGEEKK